MTNPAFPRLPDDFEQTRATLHAYAKALGTLPQTHITRHPKWWHISLKVRPAGMMIDNIALPGGGLLNGWLDLRSHQVVLETSLGGRDTIDMTAGLTGSQMADSIIERVEQYGLHGDYVRKDFESGAPTHYDTGAAARFWAALTNASSVLEAHRAAIGGTVGPVQFWPHGFDLAFEWFGTRQVAYEGDSLPAQLNLGFATSDEPYFYSVPWPLDRQLLESAPPGAGRWCDEPFAGAILDYSDVADREDGARVVTEFAQAVFDVASPTLMA